MSNGRSQSSQCVQRRLLFATAEWVWGVQALPRRRLCDAPIIRLRASCGVARGRVANGDAQNYVGKPEAVQQNARCPPYVLSAGFQVISTLGRWACAASDTAAIHFELYSLERVSRGEVVCIMYSSTVLPLCGTPMRIVLRKCRL